MKQRVLAEDIGAMLHTLPWGLMKSGATGSELIHVMMRYLGSSWVTGVMEWDMLDYLADCIAADPHLDKIYVVHTAALSTKILETYSFQESNASIENPSF